MTDESKIEQLAAALSDIVAMDGKESNIAAGERLRKAERLLRKIAPETLKSAKQRAAASEEF